MNLHQSITSGSMSCLRLAAILVAMGATAAPAATVRWAEAVQPTPEQLRLNVSRREGAAVRRLPPVESDRPSASDADRAGRNPPSAGPDNRPAEGPGLPDQTAASAATAKPKVSVEAAPQGQHSAQTSTAAAAPADGVEDITPAEENADAGAQVISQWMVHERPVRIVRQMGPELFQGSPSGAGAETSNEANDSIASGRSAFHLRATPPPASPFSLPARAETAADSQAEALARQAETTVRQPESNARLPEIRPSATRRAPPTSPSPATSRGPLPPPPAAVTRRLPTSPQGESPKIIVSNTSVPPHAVRSAVPAPGPATPARQQPAERTLPPQPAADPTRAVASAPPAAAATPLPAIEPFPSFPFTPSLEHINAQLLPAVQRSYGLAQRGAMFAARTEFIQVLRRIAEAKDAAQGTAQHAQALAAGLRALDEADDFIPRGTQLEANLDVPVVASSHRTPLAGDLQGVKPHEAVALYHEYAQRQLGFAVAGEQSGSMVLHGLGKVHARLADEADGDIRATRKSMTMFQAALLAHPANHLAANELGVLLARNGHTVQAAAMFQRALAQVPNATAGRNLAVVQRQMGLVQQAEVNGQYAELLAQQERAAGEVSRRKGIDWVTPAEMTQFGQAAALTARTPPAAGAAQRANNASQAAGAPVPFRSAQGVPQAAPAPAGRSPFQRALDTAKSIAAPVRRLARLEEAAAPSEPASVDPLGGSRPNQ